MESDSDSQFSVVLEDGGNSGTEVGVRDEGTELVEEEGEENMDRGIGEDSLAALEENQPVVAEEQHLAVTRAFWQNFAVSSKMFA